jgi:hypothetical protein
MSENANGNHKMNAERIEGVSRPISLSSGELNTVIVCNSKNQL